MATNLYINPDNTIGGLESGKVMVAPTQEEFEACCCDGCPEDCFDSQPELVCSISGSCDEVCSRFNDTFSFREYAAYNCEWVWDLYTAPYTFYIHIKKEAGVWYAYGDPCTPVPSWQIITGVSCNTTTHFLEGEFDLVCDEVLCAGCTVHVTLGG